MRVLSAPRLYVVLDFGLSEEEANDRVRTIGGRVYFHADGILMRGACREAPSEIWDCARRRWRPHSGRGGETGEWPVLLSEAEAERIMWPEYYVPRRSREGGSPAR